MPFISFIIPYYNVPLPLVEQCVRSITTLRLDEGESEIIVVDDGSSYSIKEELATICPDIVYIRQENSGPCAARNAGIEVARGEYIQFVDADDMLLGSVYAKCVEKARATGADLIMFSFSTDEAKSENDAEWSGETSGARYMTEHNLYSMVWGYLFRREILGSLRFFHSTYYEDEEFTPQLVVKAERMYFTRSAAYFYRLREGSFSVASSNIGKRLDDVYRIICTLHTCSLQLRGTARKGMERRVAQLTMDYIFNLNRLLADRKARRSRIDQLRSCGFYPLPKADYTFKYTVFRLVANNKFGMSLLPFILSLLKHKI